MREYKTAFLPSIQDLINSGDAWRLEGSVGRQCMDAIMSGYAMLGTEGHRDYYGNCVPSRTQVEPGTPGSVEFYDATQADIPPYTIP